MQARVEQRRAIRVTFEGAASLRAGRTDAPLRAQIRDLSKGGMAVTGPELPRPGARVDCRVELAGTPWVLAGKVAWARPDARPQPQAGIAFVDLSRADERVLSRVVIERLGAPVVAPMEPSVTERVVLPPTVAYVKPRQGWLVAAVVALVPILLALLWPRPARDGERPGSSSSTPEELAGVVAPPRVRALPSPVGVPSLERSAEASRGGAVDEAFTLAIDGDTTVVRIPITGRDDGLRVYRLVDPEGLAMHLPMASVPGSALGRYVVEREAVRRIWIEARDGGLHLRVLPAPEVRQLSARVEAGAAVFVLER